MQPAEEAAHLNELQKQLKEWLGEIEQRIWDLEEVYIEEATHGNIIRGWDGFLDGKPTQKKHLDENDRLFSFSSYQYWLDNHDKMEQPEAEDLSKRRTSSVMNKNNKKRRLSTKKDGIKQEDDYDGA